MFHACCCLDTCRATLTTLRAQGREVLALSSPLPLLLPLQVVPLRAITHRCVDTRLWW